MGSKARKVVGRNPGQAWAQQRGLEEGHGVAERKDDSTDDSPSVSISHESDPTDDISSVGLGSVQQQQISARQHHSSLQHKGSGRPKAEPKKPNAVRDALLSCIMHYLLFY